MGRGRSAILQLVTIHNERGVTFAAALILLFFVSLFLFSIVMWHDSLYMNFSSLETYYEKRTVELMEQTSPKNNSVNEAGGMNEKNLFSRIYGIR